MAKCTKVSFNLFNMLYHKIEHISKIEFVVRVKKKKIIILLQPDISKRIREKIQKNKRMIEMKKKKKWNK